MRMGVLSSPFLLLFASSTCLAFHPDVPTRITSTTASSARRGTTNSQKRQLRMMHFEAADGASVIEAMDHATWILAVAADSSRGGAVVEQIPYVPGDVADFDKIVIGSAACLAAYAWAAYEFGKRIVTQRACEVCKGSGLVSTSRSGKQLRQPKKCYACGGFLPWESWGKFWKTNMDVGNGGVLQRPARDYDELNE
ncbi:unnamed protein product, partial [Ectocarpus sp. 12 AP-2014]